MSADEVGQTTVPDAPADAPSGPGTDEPQPSEPPKKKFKFPTAFTVLGIVLLLVWIASFFVPPGTYNVDPKTGGPVPGTYHKLPSCSGAPPDTLCAHGNLSFRPTQLWIAPPNRLYGIENDEGFVWPDETRVIYGSAGIFFFVLAVSAFITVTMKTGAIQTGIGRLGYDRMVAASSIFLGAGTGVICSTAFTTLILMTGITAAVPYGFSALAQIKWRRIDQHTLRTPGFLRDVIVAILASVFSILFGWYSRNTGHSLWVYWAPFLLAGTALLLGIPVYKRQRRYMTEPAPMPPYPLTSSGPRKGDNSAG